MKGLISVHLHNNLAKLSSYTDTLTGLLSLYFFSPSLPSISSRGRKGEKKGGREEGRSRQFIKTTIP